LTPAPARLVLLAAAAALPFHELVLRAGPVGLRPFESLLGLAVLLALPSARRGWLRRRLVDREVLAVLLLGAVVVFLFPGPGESVRTVRLVLLEPALFYFLLTRLGVDRVQLAAALVLGGVASGLLGLVQWWVGLTIEAEGVERIRGAYRSPNNLALYLDRVIPLAAALALLTPRRAWAVAVAVMLIAQAMTFSIGGWAATGLALVFVVVWAGRRRLLVGIATIAALCAVVLALWRPERITSHLTGSGESTSFLRMRLWGSALEMLLDSPLFGVGLDNFLYRYNPARGGSYLDPSAWREPDLSHPHNLFLDWWLSLGVVGFLLLLRLLRHFYALARTGLRADGVDRALALGAAGAMVATLAHGLADNSFFLPDLAALWWASYILVCGQKPEDGALGRA
jgi:putative inorganic carbon (hco3(-)) transporter